MSALLQCARFARITAPRNSLRPFARAGRPFIDMPAIPFNQPLDELALGRLRRNCRRTQEAVYRGYADAAWTLAVRLTGCEATAWDAVQEAFVRAFGQAAQLRDGAAFGPWLRRIVVNQAMDQHRNRRREVRVDPPEAAIDGAEPAWLDLETALERLDAADRMVLWLHDVEGMTHDEIAELAGYTRSWSKSRLSRSRARMQRMLDRGDRTQPIREAMHDDHE
jgi:RNA polymerase sigma-70 factor (ECF subfamily)